MDADLRMLERRAATGDPEARVRLAREVARTRPPRKLPVVALSTSLTGLSSDSFFRRLAEAAKLGSVSDATHAFVAFNGAMATMGIEAKRLQEQFASEYPTTLERGVRVDVDVK